MIKNKIINYFFLIYFLLGFKEIIYLSDVYILSIKEIKDSEKLVYSYLKRENLKSESFKFHENKEIAENIKKRVSAFLNDKKNFYYNFSKLNYDFWEKDYRINYRNSELTNYNCYSNDSDFKDLMTRCKSWFGIHISEKIDLFDKNNDFYVLIIDNTKNKFTYKLYLELARIWNMYLLGLDAEDYNLENKIFNIEKTDYKFNFFVGKIVNIFLAYIILCYIAYISNYKND